MLKRHEEKYEYSSVDSYKRVNDGQIEGFNLGGVFNRERGPDQAINQINCQVIVA